MTITAERFFSPDQVAAIKEAILSAELNTSGEVRVYIEESCQGEPALQRAVHHFGELAMHKTEGRNGVIFYLAVTDRQFAIYGDAGINKATPPDFWDQIKEVMQMHFREGRFTEGMVEGIGMAGKKLQEHFPYNDRDLNELDDDIVFG